LGSPHIAQLGDDQLAVFFCDGAGFGIEMVPPMDVANAQDIGRAQQPTARLSAVPAELLFGQDKHKLLSAWLNEAVLAMQQ